MPDYLSLCCIIKDEDNLEEFIYYYFILGVNKIYIYDNESAVPIKQRLNNFFFNQICVIIDFPGKCQQMNAYNHCLQHYGHLTKWLIVVDGDEYIVPKTVFKLPDLLKHHEEKHAIGINWVFFGTSFHDIKPNGLLVDNFRRCDKAQDRHVKVILQPQFTQQMVNPQFGIFNDKNKYTDIKNNVIEQLAWNENYTADIIQINHYTMKSLEQANQKHYRGNADSLNLRSTYDKNLHNFANNVVDNYLPDKYLSYIYRMIEVGAVNWRTYKALNPDISHLNEQETYRHIVEHCLTEIRPLHLRNKFPNFNIKIYREENPHLNEYDDVYVEVDYITKNS